MGYSVEEIQQAFDSYREAAAEAGRTGNWELFVQCFTDDVNYIEHHYGRFQGKDQVRQWIIPAMTTFPVDHMTGFPWNWWFIDAERGWVVGEVDNIMDDPGDGQVFSSVNWSRLVYAGNGLFKEQEDVYNPTEFEGMIRGWLSAWKAAQAKNA